LARRIRLRVWQQAALEALQRSKERDFLAVATPGAGKTTFALVAARRALAERTARRLIVVVPTQHLKLQWALAAEELALHIDPEWSIRYGGLPSDVHGVAVTYQQVASSPSAMRALVGRAFVILDEVHHAADTRSWGDGIRQAFNGATQRLCLSGTPFRSDQSAIPFVRYRGEEAEADFEYGYGEALRDRTVVRPVYFPRIKGRMEWNASDGTAWSASFDDPLGRTRASQRLRTALDLEGEWLPGVLQKAHRQLVHLRTQEPNAGGMVIAMDQQHAQGIARMLRERLGTQATVATSDDPEASAKIAEFGESALPWIVAVRMVSEGVDIPRLRVGVYATHTVTDLFFRQAVGRLVRRTDLRRSQSAYMFIPDDARLRSFALGIAEQRRHSLRKPDREDDEELLRDEEDPAQAESAEDQLSLFAAISSVAFEADGAPLEPARVIEEGDEEIPGLVGDEEVLEEMVAPLPTPEIDLAPPAVEVAPARKSVHHRKRELRERNSACVRALVHATRDSHADINKRLNRQVGIRRITQATLSQLERRLVLARRWLETGRKPS
jgi:superfamily II DNA or RNA helicase